jgi:hypothetical protein
MALAPVIIQECIPNSYDLRVTVVGNKVFPVAIRKPNDVDEVDWRAIDAKPHPLRRSSDIDRAGAFVPKPCAFLRTRLRRA